MHPLSAYHGRPCPYCGEGMIGGKRRATRDHCFVPRAKGGDLNNGNRLIVCFQCNQDKRDMTLDEFLTALCHTEDPRAEFVAKIVRSYGGFVGQERGHQISAARRKRGPRQPAVRYAKICSTCAHYKALSPGKAAICIERWRHLKWNEAVPLTMPDETCNKHELRDGVLA